METSKNIKKISSNVLEFTENWLESIGVNPAYSDELKFLAATLSLIVVSLIVDFITKQVILKIIQRLVNKTKTDWDDIMLEKKVFHNLAHLAPALILGLLVPIVFEGHPEWIKFGSKASSVYLIGGVIILLISLVKTLQVFLSRRPFLKDQPIESYLQVVRIIIYLIGGIYLISVLFDKSPWGIFSALGAMSVVLLLVFKDTILGFVASIQLAANDMVKIGDWVEIPKYGADGEIFEIKLQTIKIRNWDKTISNVPSYAFVSESFKNWRGMQESEGRRIKRSINIDVNSIKFCNDEMIERFKKIKFIKGILEDRIKEVNQYNTEQEFDLQSLVNGRRLTNIGTFRAYIEAYLKNNENINKDLTFIVRQLQPTEAGLPIEIYVFCYDKRWANYEAIQADIFDHILAIVGEFDLNIFQHPSGKDFQKILK